MVFLLYTPGQHEISRQPSMRSKILSAWGNIQYIKWEIIIPGYILFFDHKRDPVKSIVK